MNAPEIIVGDITKLPVDAIVNAANELLASGGGVCGAIHAVAGPQLAEECVGLTYCPTGDAKITGGYDLPARHVIHGVGPVYEDGRHGEEELLASCYQRCLEVAHEHGLESIAFPCISTGIYGYPFEEATTIALRVIGEWLRGGAQPARVICCCFAEKDAETYRNLLATVDG